MRQFNFLFYVTLFLGFFLPNNASFYFTLPGVQLQVRELAFLLLPLLNAIFVSDGKAWRSDRKLKKLIVAFVLIVIVTEIFKHVYFDEPIGNAIKTIRMGLPLLSSIWLLYAGIRADLQLVWRTILWAISVSVVLTLMSFFVNIPIYSTYEGENILEATQGRLMNANSSFGIIGIFLLYKSKNRWYDGGWLSRMTALLSVAALILSFNRTYLALLSLAFVYFSFTEASIRKAIKTAFIPLIALGIFWAAYNFSDVIQGQVDRRILDVIFGNTQLSESVYENNRDFITEGIKSRISEGYWAFGLPYSIDIFNFSIEREVIVGTKTDISFVNVLLRHGILPLFLLCLIFYRLFALRFLMFRYALLIYSLASFNIDALFAHNTIFFLIIVYAVGQYEGRDMAIRNISEKWI